jgi:hypothetical protein
VAAAGEAEGGRASAAIMDAMLRIACPPGYLASLWSPKPLRRQGRLRRQGSPPRQGQGSIRNLRCVLALPGASSLSNITARRQHQQQHAAQRSSSSSSSSRKSEAREERGASRRGMTGAGFIAKLALVVQDRSAASFVSWTPRGTLKVSASDRCATDVLAKYLKHANVQSFIRYLNLYGFRKTGGEGGQGGGGRGGGEAGGGAAAAEYSHSVFRPGNEHLFKDIRIRPKNLPAGAAASRAKSPSHAALPGCGTGGGGGRGHALGGGTLASKEGLKEGLAINLFSSQWLTGSRFAGQKKEKKVANTAGGKAVGIGCGRGVTEERGSARKAEERGRRRGTRRGRSSSLSSGQKRGGRERAKGRGEGSRSEGGWETEDTELRAEEEEEEEEEEREGRAEGKGEKRGGGGRAVEEEGGRVTLEGGGKAKRRAAGGERERERSGGGLVCRWHEGCHLRPSYGNDRSND